MLGIAFVLAPLAFVLVRIGFEAMVFRWAGFRIPAIALARRMKTNCIKAIADSRIVIDPATRRPPNGIALRQVRFLRCLVRTSYLVRFFKRFKGPHRRRDLAPISRPRRCGRAWRFTRFRSARPGLLRLVERITLSDQTSQLCERIPPAKFAAGFGCSRTTPGILIRAV